MFEKILRFHEILPDMFEKVFFSQQESTESTEVNITSIIHIQQIQHSIFAS